MSKQWKLVHDDQTHVIPMEDDIDHEESVFCVCGPLVEKQRSGILIVVHKSSDRREYFEENSDHHVH